LIWEQGSAQPQGKCYLLFLCLPDRVDFEWHECFSLNSYFSISVEIT
jgi:hypothetical protein